MLKFLAVMCLPLSIFACAPKEGKSFQDLAESPKLITTVAGCEAYRTRDEAGRVYLIVKGANCSVTGGR